MKYNLSYTERFSKAYKKMTDIEKKQIQNKLKMLAENPMHPSLRAKRIKGTDNIFECSVNMNIRVIWYFEGDKIIILLDVGHHDILKKL